MTKVAYVLMAFPVKSETFLISDVISLNSLGYQVSIHAYRELPSFTGDEVPAKVYYGSFLKGLSLCFRYPKLFLKTLRWLLSHSTLEAVIKALVLLPRAFAILEQLKAERPQIVHLFWGHYPSIVGYLVKQSNINVKVSIFLGAYDLEARLGVTKDFLENADFLFTHSFANVSKIKKYFNENLTPHVIHRGVDINKLQSTSIGTGKVPEIWTTAGRLIKSKRFDLAIHLFKAYSERKRNSTSKLMIIGDGPERSSLKLLVDQLGLSERIEFKGHVDQKSFFDVLANSNVFVFLSRKPGECLPNVVKEAMYFKNICIVSETTGIDELIDDGVDGFVFSSENIETFDFDKLQNEQALSMGQKAHQKINLEFNNKEQMKKYITAWEISINDKK